MLGLPSSQPPRTTHRGFTVRSRVCEKMRRLRPNERTRLVPDVPVRRWSYSWSACVSVLVFGIVIMAMTGPSSKRKRDRGTVFLSEPAVFLSEPARSSSIVQQPPWSLEHDILENLHVDM